MKRYLKFAETIILITIFLSCNSNPLEEPIAPGRRDYTWTVDTLNSPFNYFFGLWGSKHDDVWAVGSGGSSTDRLWHFDGIKWSLYNKEPIFCTGNALWGSTKNNVWMVGGDGKIWHYNGIVWSENFVYKVDNAYSISIEDIWGRSNNDIYAVGLITLNSNKEQNGFILYFNGNKWSEIYRANYSSQFNGVLGDSKNIFVSGARITNINNHITIDSMYIKRLINNSLKNVIAANDGSWVEPATVGGNVHFVSGNELYKYENNSVKKVYNFAGYNFGQAVYGRSMNDLFVRMTDGIAHYNGIDIVYLFKFNDNFASYVGRPLDFGDYIFFNIADIGNGRNYNLRGKLN